MVYFAPILLIAGLFIGAVPTDCKSSTVGRDFVFGIFEMIDVCCHDPRNIIALDITNNSPNLAVVRLQIPFLQNDTAFLISTGEGKTLIIDPSIQRDGTFKDSRGIKISADHDISVLVTNAFNSVNNIDSYNIIPVNELGTDYSISSYFGAASNIGSELLVAAIQNNTKVTLKNETSVIQSVVLNEFDVFQFLYDTGDLTGTRVISDKNVYVVSGSTFTGIPSGSQEYIASEMFPASAWSKSYIIPPVLPKSAFMIRIITNSSNDVTLASLTQTYRLKPSIKDQYFGSEAVVATSESPFYVTQYGVNNDYGNKVGDPFMVAVPGIDMYINDYRFSVPHEYYNVKYYVAIVVPNIGISGLELDNRSVQSYNTTTITVPIPYNNFKVLNLPIKGGYHHFYHPNNSIKYGVLIYGHGPELSSSYFAGYNLKALGPMCYSCEDLSHIDLCDTVKQCDRLEVCYVERYKDGAQIKYKSGCLPLGTCEAKRNSSSFSDTLCHECCYADFCNNQGCGENGIPNRDKRGPICFDCQHVSSPDECSKIIPCEIHQVCRIEEYKWFDHSHFKLSCGYGLCDPVNRNVGHVIQRSTPVCQSCCSDDYCNRNCTTSQDQTGTVIIG